MLVTAIFFTFQYLLKAYQKVTHLFLCFNTTAFQRTGTLIFAVLFEYFRIITLGVFVAHILRL